MADLIASVADLQLTEPGIDPATATQLLERATGVVQGILGGQRLVSATGDTAELLATTDSWLDLPQRPVTAVTAVTVDGEAITAGTGDGQYRRFGSRLWRTGGWAADPFTPSEVVVTYDHGYAEDAQELQQARDVVLTLAAQAYRDPTRRVTGLAIDDYREQYTVTADMVPRDVRASLRRRYLRRGGLVKL